MSDKLTIPAPRIAPFGLEITQQAVQEVWDVFVKPFQDEVQSMEMRALMAILRAVYQGMEPVE